MRVKYEQHEGRDILHNTIMDDTRRRFLFFFDHTDQQSTEMLSKFDFGFRCFHHSGQDSYYFTDRYRQIVLNFDLLSTPRIQNTLPKIIFIIIVFK